MKKLLILLGVLLVTSCGPTPQGSYNYQQQEVEDCDLDDMMEGDDDCYANDYYNYSKSKPKTIITKPKVTSPKAVARTSTYNYSTPKTAVRSYSAPRSTSSRSTRR